MGRGSSKRTRPSPTAFAILLALLILPLVLAPRAEAYIYWSHVGTGTIGRANLDGTGVDPSFFDHRAVAMTVDARHIYWSHGGDDGAVRRAKIDGTGVDPKFITGLVPVICDRGGCTGLTDLAVDAAHIYGTGTYANTIGRANLDGTRVDQNLFTASLPLGLGVDASHVYWVTFDPSTMALYRDAVGRANLDGTTVDENFIGGLNTAVDVAADADHVYWTSASGTGGLPTIGRANLDGTEVDRDFITITTSVAYTDATLAVDDSHLYWTNEVEGTIGRANLDGTEVDERFISGLDYPTEIAINALRPVGKATANRTQRQEGKKIRVEVNVRAKQRLTAKVTGRIEIGPTYKLKPKKVHVAAGMTKRLKLMPKNAAAKKIAEALKRGERARAKVRVKLADEAGNRKIEKLRVRLKG